MARRRGGYLGGSTVINPRRKSATVDEGPIAALERARIENRQIDVERHVRLLEQEVADEKLAVVEEALRKFAVFLDYNFTDEAAESAKVVATFLAEEAAVLSPTSPGARRRLHIIREDYSVLVEALSADKSDRFGLLWKTTVYQTHIRPIYDAAWRKAQSRFR